MSARKFIVTLTADLYDSTGASKYRDIGLSELAEHPHIEQRVFKEHRLHIGADQIGDAQGVIVLTPAVTAESVSKADKLLVMARFGVGYNAPDMHACTAADVLVTITTGAVERPVAEAAIGWMIALTHNVRVASTASRALDWFLRTLDYAAACGAKHVTTLPGVFFDVGKPADSWPRSCEELAWRVEQAKQHRIVFSVEAHVGSSVYMRCS